MPYTVWSRGRLIGQSELAYRRSLPGLRMGDFFPSELGDQLMPILTGEGPALIALYEVAEDTQRERPESVRPGDWPDGVRQTTEYADAMSICDELESLDLQLRDPFGEVVNTESISIRDTHRLLALAREHEDDDRDVELTEGEMKEVEEMRAELDTLFKEEEYKPWEPEPEFPRYQVMVTLAGFEGGMLGRAERSD